MFTRGSTSPFVDCSLERTSLGLLIHFSSSPSVTTLRQHADIIYSDETFECLASDLRHLIDYIKESRVDLWRRIHTGEGANLLCPLTDPPLIRVTKNSKTRSYFNLGELFRWRFLRKLRKYPFKIHQTYGANWLRGRAAAILADDMGLGKTLQAIAALEDMQHSGRIRNALVLCPKSLIGVWEAEINLWASRLCTVALHSSVDTREWRVLQKHCQVAITNYEAIRSDRPASGTFDLVIFDEIHRLKNPRSQNYAAAYLLNPPFAWGLSGTPLENHAGDLTAILHLLDRKRVSRRDRDLSPATLRSLSARYILRRSRGVISSELPRVMERIELVPLSPEQRRTYDAIRGCRKTVETVGVWISIFNRLRSVCDFDPETKKSSKIDRAVVIIGAVRALREKLVVFSSKIEPLELLYREVVQRHGVSAAEMVTGQTDSTSRSRVVERFQSEPEPFVLLCSIRATAEGLTLTAANHVLFLNEWWNPSVNTQARDRVNRIGQQRTVKVYRLRSQGTVESRIGDLLTSKTALFDEIIARLADSSDSTKDSPSEDMIELLL